MTTKTWVVTICKGNSKVFGLKIDGRTTTQKVGNLAGYLAERVIEESNFAGNSAQLNKTSEDGVNARRPKNRHSQEPQTNKN